MSPPPPPTKRCSRVIYRALFLLKGAPCLVTLCSRKFWAESGVTVIRILTRVRAWARRTGLNPDYGRFLYPVVIAEMDLNLAATQALCGALCCHAASTLIDLLYTSLTYIQARAGLRCINLLGATRLMNQSQTYGACILAAPVSWQPLYPGSTCILAATVSWQPLSSEH